MLENERFELSQRVEDLQRMKDQLTNQLSSVHGELKAEKTKNEALENSKNKVSLHTFPAA